MAIGRKELLFSWEEVEGAYQLIFQLPPKIEEVLKSYAGFLKTEGEWEEEAEIKLEVMGEGGRRKKEKEGEKKEEEEGGNKEEKEEEEEEERRRKEEERRKMETEKWLRKFLGAFKLQIEMKGLKGILRAYKKYKVKLDRWRIKSWQFGLLGMINGGKINIELEPRQLVETEDEKSEKERGKMEEEGGRMEEEEGKRMENEGQRRKEENEEEGWEEEIIKNLVEVLKIDETSEMEVELMKMVEEMEWSELEVNLKGVLKLEAKMKRD